jgi:hypothetical protein
MMMKTKLTQTRTVVLGVLRACGPVGAFEEVFLPAVRSLEPNAAIDDVRRELEWFERGCVACSQVDRTGRRSWKMVAHYSAERH